MQIGALERRDIIEKSLTDYGAVVVFDTLPAALAFADELAPEHLEICVKEPMNSLGVVNNAGSVFLGDYSPESLGDYYAGPNHVLPTGGTARFFSPLSVDDFIKKSSFTYYTKDALLKEAEKINTFAQREGLTAHGKSAMIRLEKEGKK
ncbi:Histidinol dehydrogenase [bioreactor metagenome]|uniref:Histidinol dehydrogenase n=1 Tax=bioreactor metagenome TaxID=1076179 RepID=A0A645I0D9_9ZZZZ